MSQYVNFFLRRGDEFIPLKDYSRSSPIYSVMNAPYEKIREYSYSDLEAKILRLKGMKEENAAMITRIWERINSVYHLNNSVEEKMEYVNDYYSQISDFEDDNKNLDRCMIELEFIADLVYMDCTIYAGVEIEEPTLEDVVKMGE